MTRALSHRRRVDKLLELVEAHLMPEVERLPPVLLEVHDGRHARRKVDDGAPECEPLARDLILVGLTHGGDAAGGDGAHRGRS